MKFLPTSLRGSYVIELQPFSDHRGLFSRIFCRELFATMGLIKNISQINFSRTVQQGAIRGMHFQYPPKAEIKMVKCLQGAVFDVIVDLRRHSPTYLQYCGVELTPHNNRMMYIPEGFAHGFQTLKPNSELLYLHTEMYSPECEGSVRFDDPRIGITWPLPLTDISTRDQNHPYLDDSFQGIVL